MSPPPAVSSSSLTASSSSTTGQASLTSSSSQSPSCLIPPPSKSCPRNRSSSLTIPSASAPMNNGVMVKRIGSNRSPPGSGKQQLTPSSSPEPGSSPRALAVAGWQSLVDENAELRTMAGEEGIRLIEDEFDEDGDESEEEEEADVFAITDSQKEYYVKQFLSVQPDISGKVSGSVAKGFFEKSSLTTNDLAHIWFLADYDKEGCLNVDKWCVAMHLTVLRRNQIDLPSTLPPVLLATAIPGHKSVGRHFSSASGSQSSSHNNGTSSLLIPSCDPLQDNNAPAGSVQSTNNTWTKFSNSPTSVDTVSHDLHSLQLIPDVSNRQRTASSSSGSYLTTATAKFQPQISMPTNHVPQQQYHSLDPVFLNQQSAAAGTQAPANFDFNASSIETNPAILHPIPLRLTPEAKNLLQCLSEHPNKNSNGQFKGFVPPPPPPPRRPIGQTFGGHARSSSLDLNRLGGRTGTSFLNDQHQYNNKHHNSLSNCYSGKAAAPLPLLPPPSSPLPPLPPAAVTSSNGQGLNQISSSSDSSHGAFTIYRKKHVATILPPDSSSSPSNASSSSLTSLDELMVNLRATYCIPHESFIPADPNESSELLRCLKGLSERNLHFERMNDRLITEIALLKMKNQRLEKVISQMNQGHVLSSSHKR